MDYQARREEKPGPHLAIGGIAQNLMKTVLAQRAIFGERNNAHELLAATGGQQLFRRFPAIEVDLPSDAPVGLKWEPFLRGWPEVGYYFFCRTVPDAAAKRAGMVRTQILALELSEAQTVENLGPIFSELAKPWDADGTLAPFTFSTGESTAELASTLPPARVVAVAELLAAGTSGSAPVAVSGQKGFTDLISELWRRMPSSIRRELAFGFSFSPADLSHRNLHIVCFPKGIIERWRTYPRCIDEDAPSKPIGVATAFVLGISSPASVRHFIQQAGLSEPSLATLAVYARAAEYWTKRTQLDFHGWCALAKDLTALAPDQCQAAAIKAEVEAELARLLVSGGASAVLSLRNLSVGALGENRTNIGTAVRAWISRELKSGTAAAQDEILQILRSLERSASADWLAWVKNGLADALNNATVTVATTCWSLWQRDESVFPSLALLIPDNRSAEAPWAQSAPSTLTDSLGRAVAIWCEERQWWNCYAKVLLASKGWKAAVHEYLAADSDEARLEPLRLLLSSVDPVRATEFAASSQDRRARECAADICLGHPEVFASFDGRSEGWRNLLRRSVAKDNKLVERLNAGQKVLFSLLDCAIDHIPLDEQLLASFAGSRLADLTDYPQRQKIWAQIPSTLRDAFLVATANGWLQRYLQSPTDRPELEPMLRAELLSRSLQGKRLSPQQAGLAQGGLALLKSFPEVTEEFFLEWVNALAASRQQLSAGQTAELAALLKEKSWDTGAWRLKYHADTQWRSDLRAVWDKYWSSFSWQERVFMRFASHSSNTGLTPSTNEPPIMSVQTNSRERKTVFITALNLEFLAVQAHLGEFREDTIEGTVYGVGIFEHDGQRCEVIVALAGMGNAEATLATERALREFMPNYAFFVGISGALKDELNIGDVVAADKVYAYESGKAQKEFRPRPKAPWISYASVQRANAVARDTRWLKRIHPRPAIEPKAYVKAIAAGEKVIDSHEAEVYLLIKQSYSDAYAVAMEEFGFAAAAHANPAVTFAVVRGISDAAQNKVQAEQQNSQELAARHAAAFAFEMLAGFLEADAGQKGTKDY